MGVRGGDGGGGDGDRYPLGAHCPFLGVFRIYPTSRM